MKESKEENQIKEKNKTDNKIENNTLNKNNNKNQDTFMYNGKIFKKYKRLNRYKRKNNIKRIIYKCTNNRKDENLRKGKKNKSFCNATIIYIEPNQNIKSGYFLEKEHSQEYLELDNYIKIEKKQTTKKKKNS